jgi:hypothetical protein
MPDACFCHLPSAIRQEQLVSAGEVEMSMRRSELMTFGRRFRLASALCLVFAGACYQSVPVDSGAVTVGREVVLDLTDRGAIELASQLGVQLRSVAGRVNTVSADRYDVSVTQTTSRSGVETIWRGESAVIQRQYVDRLYERRVDRKRTWIVAGLTIAGAVLTGEAFGIDTGLDGLLGGGRKGSKQ